MVNKELYKLEPAVANSLFLGILGLYRYCHSRINSDISVSEASMYFFYNFPDLIKSRTGLDVIVDSQKKKIL